MSPEELLARGDAPIKAAYLIDGQNEKPQERSSEMLEMIQTKSKNKSRKDRKRRNAGELCISFAKGTCRYGDNCRFNHDVAKVMQHKAPDLPGLCPFTHAQPCPYGMNCRWARTHPTPADAADPGTDAGLPGGSRADAGGRDTVWLQQLELQPEAQVLASRNWMHRNVQQLLRAKKFDFGRTDAVLSSLGLQVSKVQKKKDAGKTPALPDPAAQQGLSATRDAEAMTSSHREESGEPAVLEGPSSKKARHEEMVEAQPPIDEGPDPAAAPEKNGSQGTDVPMRPGEKKRLDFRGKLYLAPLTTVGNLPFRRVCKSYGVDITCGEMAMATNLLQGQPSEWALLRRHASEDFFGVQVCGGYPDSLSRCAQMLDEHIDVDFVDVNMGCPIDIVCNRGAGSALLTKPGRIEQIARAMGGLLRCPLTLKIRKGYSDDKDIAHTLLPRLYATGQVAAVTLHGRSRQQRYSRLADWDYIDRCAAACPDLPLIGNGDVVSFEDWNGRMQSGQLATGMIARGALIKPWIFTEIKEQRHWDISASERLDMLKQYVSAGLQHWGSDTRGIETTRRFLLEWISFLHRYIPIGLLEVLPQRLNWRTPKFVGRSDLETRLASPDMLDWIDLSTMLLGSPPAGFTFVPKHKAAAHVPVGGGPTQQGTIEDEENG
ncbi:hypothetical protein WJX84_007467 [Apatococcus fuscideae]|uniref:tRNA-dihydrouridine(47) synthase [NAD(P)(+)] n=1 Tax=Apatococcus fuscideae TaxID=2026836 RepID=A0AAW1TD21_9CHLO